MTQEAIELKNTVAKEPKGDKRQYLTNAGKGRPKGVRNKLTRSAQEVIQKAFIGIGGEKELIAWANKSDKNKGAFYTLIWSKIIPRNIDLNANLTLDLAQTLLEGRKLKQNIENQLEHKPILEITNQGKVLSTIATGSIIEQVENEEKDAE